MAEPMTWDELLSEAGRRVSGEPERAQVARDLASLRALFGDSGECPAPVVDLLRAIAAGPDPPGALNLLERFVAAQDDRAVLLARLSTVPRAAHILAAVFGYSEFLSNVLIRTPHLVWEIAEGGALERPKDYDDFHAEAAGLCPAWNCGDECRAALCRWKYRELLRVGIRDVLKLATVEEVSREISDIARACIELAALAAWNDLIARHGVPQIETELLPSREAGLCVLGMGKLGGRELNFSSDIDLIFIYDDEGQTSGVTPAGKKVAPLSNHEFFNRMGERMVRFLSTHGPDGYLFRVDMRLRPEGKSGPLARSLESFVNYLEQQARDWERLAYLKARVMTGPASLAARLYQFISRFVFDTADPARITSEIEKLKLMIDREVLLSETYHREVKRGYGGIREIEFIIAAMQIIYGQTHAALRVRNIFLAIERLAEVNILSREEADFYLRAYSFLRLVEHRLQMAQEHQTHLLPARREELLVLANRCGFDSVEDFERVYREVTDGVHERFTRFFERDIEAEAHELQEVLALLDPDADPAEAIAVLDRYGIGSEHSLRLIHDLAQGTREVFITAQGQKYFEQMLPSFLRLIARSPMPARVLPHFHSFMQAVRGITYYYELIANHPDILRLLVTLFGSSDYFAEVLCSHPEFFDAILGSRLVHESSGPASVAQRVRDAVGARGKWERRAIGLRRAVKFEQLLVALRYLLGLRPIATVVDELSTIADVALDVASELALESYCARIRESADAAAGRAAELHPEATNAPITVIALGKYGGRELNFFADLDIVYVWNDAAAGEGALCRNAAEALQLVDQFVFTVTEHMPEGRLYALDARLRPDGRNSPLVTPLSYYTAYLRQTAEIWELMAFTRARCVLGDERVYRQLLEAARDGLARWQAEEIRSYAAGMRLRLEQAVAPADAAKGEFKRSAGGLTDVEFLLQYWGLAGFLPLSAIQGQSYLRLLAAPPRELPCAAGDWRVLADTYSFFRRTETAIRLVTKEAAPRLPSDDTLRQGIARMLGEASIEGVEERLVAARRAVRAVFRRVFPEVPPLTGASG
jgi:glutamate-ammonia-ligase adenylyltransferase